MFLLEKTYDIDEIVRNNMHTHSINSLCSKPEMVFEEMIKKQRKEVFIHLQSPTIPTREAILMCFQTPLTSKSGLKGLIRR